MIINQKQKLIKKYQTKLYRLERNMKILSIFDKEKYNQFEEYSRPLKSTLKSIIKDLNKF